jgi:HlyD family secretion protein
MKKLLLFLVLPLALVVLVVAKALSDGDEVEYRSVAVARGSVVESAVAVGRVEPRFEVPVKARNGGILRRCFVELGQRVSERDPLVEVRPVVNELDMLAAERRLEQAEEARQSAEELEGGENLMGRSMLWFQGRKNVERATRGAERGYASAVEALELLREGQVEVEGRLVDFIVRAPIEGHVIELQSELGQPVVPASSYGSGTVLLVLADMDHPIFRGTVDETEVGKLKSGMQATLEIGALPGTSMPAELVEISLRSREQNNATVFDVKMTISPPPELVLRSGYSAVARIEVARADDVLVLPERVVEYRGESAFVLVHDDRGDPVEHGVEVGLSDGLTVEIVSGLDEGSEVLERIW